MTPAAAVLRLRVADVPRTGRSGVNNSLVKLFTVAMPREKIKAVFSALT